MTRQILVFLIVSIFLTACISTKEFTSYVAPKYQNIKTIPNDNQLVFDLSALKDMNKAVTSTRTKSLFIPAILYWQWNKTIKCEINPVILGKIFQESFLKYADSLKVKEKLQRRKLEIKIENIPNNFVYTQDSFFLMLILFYVSSEYELLFPQKQNLIVSYKLSENGLTTKEGKLIAINQEQPIKNPWDSTLKFIWLYLEQFEQNNQRMTKEIAKQLLIEL